MNTLNLFYGEPDFDRWLPLDRFPRRIIRRLIRGKPQPGGHMRTFLNLCAGLDRIGQRYRVNDFSYTRNNTNEAVGIIGKSHLLEKIDWKNPIAFGTCTYSHPCEAPELLQRLPVKVILAYGEWMRQMCEPDWGDKVTVWPVGIDTRKWSPAPPDGKEVDVLIYDKVRWEHERFKDELIEPIIAHLGLKKMSFETLRYGFYREEEFHRLLARSRMMIFLCEHETQGIAYQQVLSCNVPVLAWDRGGFWKDPSFYPHRVRFAPVSSVPYWDERCGVKFTDAKDFPDKLEEFIDKEARRKFSPRDYILENLTLEKCAENYVKIFDGIQ